MGKRQSKNRNNTTSAAVDELKAHQVKSDKSDPSSRQLTAMPTRMPEDPDRYVKSGIQVPAPQNKKPPPVAVKQRRPSQGSCSAVDPAAEEAQRLQQHVEDLIKSGYDTTITIMHNLKQKVDYKSNLK